MIVILPIVSALVIYAIMDGIATASLFAILVLLAWFMIGRTLARWESLDTKRRIYGCAVSVGAIVLVSFFVIRVATNDSNARNRTARHLNREFALQPKFDAIEVRYREKKIDYVCVLGTVKNDDDFELLKQEIRDNNWRGVRAVYWRVEVEETGVIHDQSDYEFFDDD